LQKGHYSTALSRRKRTAFCQALKWRVYFPAGLRWEAETFRPTRREAFIPRRFNTKKPRSMAKWLTRGNNWFWTKSGHPGSNCQGPKLVAAYFQEKHEFERLGQSEQRWASEFRFLMAADQSGSGANMVEEGDNFRGDFVLTG